MERNAARAYDCVRVRNLQRVDGTAVRLTRGRSYAQPPGPEVESAVTRWRDPLLLPRDRRQHTRAVPLRPEAHGPFDLVGAADPNPVGVLGRLRGPSYPPGRDNPHAGQEAHDAVGKLVAHKADLKDHARAAVDQRPRPVALEQP